MHRKMEDAQKEKSTSHFEFENIGTLIRYGTYPLSISSKEFWVVKIQNTQELWHQQREK